MKQCEACRQRPVEIEEPCDNPEQPYFLCRECHERLHKLALRPREWYNLAVIHSPACYLLHDDFYDEDGEASQPGENVEAEAADLAPVLAEVRGDQEALLDFAMTQWFLEDDVIAVLAEHSRASVLQSVMSRFSSTRNEEIRSRLLEITASVLQEEAAEWVRELWRGEENLRLLPELSQAAAGCLPEEEGLRYVLGKLEEMPEKERALYVFSCLYRFRSPRILDWLEGHVTLFHDNYGRLASLCFPTWQRMQAWLQLGRPLSLIALDAMANCRRDTGDLYVRKYRPQILRTNPEEVGPVLQAYYETDTVPRVRMKTAVIVAKQAEVFAAAGDSEML